VGKRIAITLLVILVAALGVIGYYLQQGRRTLLTDPYKAISPRACIIIETIDLQSFLNSLTTGKGLFGETGKVRELDNFNRKLKFLADQLNKAEFKKFLTDGSAIISFFPSGGGTLKTLLSMTVPGEIRYRHIKEMLNSSGIKNFTESKINGNQVLKVPFTINDTRDTTYISLVSGLMLCSSSSELIKEASNQISLGNDIRNIPGFSKVLLASGKNEDKIFIVFANLPELFKTLLAGEGLKLTKKISKIAGTACGDIYLNEEGLVLSGYTESIDTSEFLNKFKSLAPKEFHTYKILPAATVLFETIIPPEKKFNIRTGTVISQKTLDFALKLKEFTGDEVTRAYIDIKDRPVADNTLIIYELKDRAQAEQLFLNESGNSREIFYFQPDDQIKVPIYKTGYNGLINVFLPGFAPTADDTFFAFYDRFLITGSSYVTISRLLYDNLLNKTLANDLIYRDFESTLPSRGSYYFYCVPSKIADYLAGFVNEELIRAIRANINSLNKIQAAGYQLSSSNGMIYNSISIRYKEEAREESPTEWETLLDTTASIKPFFFTNHITGAKEIFIQDLKNNAYLVNTAGRVLWKVPLNERIVSNIYMIDYFRNGKYQLLFSGKNFLHLLDRNGNYVERYPVKLRSPATNSMTLYDYDNNLNYRLFIAGEDKMIYSYEKSGNVVRGWKPFRSTGVIRSEISYFKVSGKDYLVASDESTIYFLDRSGNIRLNLKEPVIKANGSALRLIPGSDPYLVCSSPEGTIEQIYFDGTIKKFSLKIFSEQHSFDIFDVDGDGFGEYIFIDKGMLYLYDHNKTEMFVRQFGSPELGGPINFIFSASDRKIGVYDINNKLIYLIDKNGETMKGFPLRGASMFSIGKLSDKSVWHLIVGGTDRFLYNYKIGTETK
jgi:hypothetical protein